MDRRDILLDGITREMVGVEVGPWHSPLAPKREGYHALSLDVFDLARLREIAAADATISPDMMARIEAVDLVGPAMDIGAVVAARGLAGQLDYILSSHNFEHLPDPVRFLQGCAEALRPGGVLSMAIPDRRGCFDFFRPFATTAGMLAAYAEERRQPSPATLLEQSLMDSRRRIGRIETGSWSFDDPPDGVFAISDVEAAWNGYKTRMATPDRPYVDAHCWVLTPSVFEVVIRDLHFLGLVPLSLSHVSESNGNEFYVRLTRDAAPRDAASVFYGRRSMLLQHCIEEMPSAAEQPRVMELGEAALRSECDRLHQECDALRATAERRATEIALLHRSTSWRVTAPLRRLRRMLG
jgi:SAM-dependent methyltransferase